MDAERWHRLEELFHEATTLPYSCRGAFLKRVSSDDPELAAELAALLSASGMSEKFVDEVIRKAVGSRQ